MADTYEYEGQIDETYATYEDGGHVHEIDHLGIGYDSQWGEFAVYCNERQVGYFAIPESALKPEFRPATLPPLDELIRLAKEAMAADD